MKDKTWIGHLEELRKRLIFSILLIVAACIPVYLLYDILYDLLINPVRPLLLDFNLNLYSSTIYEALLVKLKITLLAAFILTLPVHLFNICGFIFPGLKKREKAFLTVIIAFIFILGSAGILYGYKLIIPKVFSFFLHDSLYPEFVNILLNLNTNLFFIIQLLLAFLLVLQFPLVLTSLLVLKIVTVRQLIRASRIVIVVIFVLSALITPPDIFSQLAVAGPLIVLYFLTIFFAWIFSLSKRGKGISVSSD